MCGDASTQETTPSQTDIDPGSNGTNWFDDWKAEIPDEPTFAELVFTKYKELQGQPVKGPQDQTGIERLVKFLRTYWEWEALLEKEKEGHIGLKDGQDELRLYNAFCAVAKPEQEWEGILQIELRNLFKE